MPRIQLVSTGMEALIDNEDISSIKEHTWYVLQSQTGKYYAYTKVNGSTLYMHSLILPHKVGFSVDHISRDTLDNRRSNLRYATMRQQLMNTDKYNRFKKIVTSDYKGVSWDKWTKSWVARIKVNGKYKNLGRFDNELNAALAYNMAAIKYFGEFAKLNNLPETWEGKL